MGYGAHERDFGQIVPKIQVSLFLWHGHFFANANYALRIKHFALSKLYKNFGIPEFNPYLCKDIKKLIHYGLSK